MPELQCLNCGRSFDSYPSPRNCYCGGRIAEVNTGA